MDYGRSMRAVKGSLGHSLSVRYKESERPRSTGAVGPGTGGGLCRQAGVSRMAGQLPVQTLSGVVQLQQSSGRNAEDRRVHAPLRLSGPTN